MKSGNNKKRYIITFYIVVFALGIIVWTKTYIPEPEIHDGKIQRSYTEILKYLDEAPEDITAQPYEAHLSKIVQKDIQRMLASEEELVIYYENADKSSQILIRRDDRNEEKIQIAIFGISEYMDLFPWDDAIVDEISFYKKGDHIAIYGKDWIPFRNLLITDVPLTGKPSRSSCDLDLCGTDYFENYDSIWNFSDEMTLIRKGNEFAFFKSGVQQGLTTVFTGKIVEMDEKFQYILDDEQNLWYMAYSSVLEDPWIHFVKVDENVSEVLDDTLDVWSDEKISLMTFPIYIKNGKRYAGIQNSNFHLGNKEPMEILNFDVDIIELNEQNIKEVEIEYRDFVDEWFAKMIYDDSPCLIYERKKIFDTSQISNIPAEEIELFNGITVSWSEFDETVNELKKAYEKYEQK